MIRRGISEGVLVVFGEGVDSHGVLGMGFLMRPNVPLHLDLARLGLQSPGCWAEFQAKDGRSCREAHQTILTCTGTHFVYSACKYLNHDLPGDIAHTVESGDKVSQTVNNFQGPGKVLLRAFPCKNLF